MIVRVALVCVVLIVAGCGPPKSGEVVEKRHEAMGTYTQMDPVFTGQTCNKIGQTTYCQNHYIYVRHTYVDDEDWVLIVKNKKGKKGKVYVTQQVWDAKWIGAHYDRKKDGGGGDRDRRA